MKESSLYVHIPYCGGKCIYCDFFSGNVKLANWHSFSQAIINELLERKKEFQIIPDTLYIGGGTPSIMPSDDFVFLINRINNIINPTGNWKEFTIEVNPDDVTVEKCQAWHSVGVNRVSIGVQSLNDDELIAIRRRHNSATALRAYDCLERYFDNISVDLMFGIPGQTYDSWKQTVNRVINLHPKHISAYSLMLEEKTPLTILHNEGKINIPDDEENDKMWEFLSSELLRMGYEQYEISNYCINGYRAVHNSRYWSGNPYLGLGPSAHSYDGKNIRRSNPCNLNGYIKRYSPNSIEYIRKKQFFIEEKLSVAELIEEHILTRLRTKEGLSIESFKNDFGDENTERLLDNAKLSLQNSTLKMDNDHLVLTHRGIMLSNQIMLSLIM